MAERSVKAKVKSHLAAEKPLVHTISVPTMRLFVYWGLDWHPIIYDTHLPLYLKPPQPYANLHAPHPLKP